MGIARLDQSAERLMRDWMLPGLLGAVALFCLALATYAVIDGHAAGGLVLAAVALALAGLGDDARRRPLKR